MRLLVTGGAGFIGCNFVRYTLEKHLEDTVINIDKLTYSGSLDNLTQVLDHPRHIFAHLDICDRRKMESCFSRGVDAVVHFAAESHVDRSILDCSPFMKTNVLGTESLMDVSRRSGVKRFLLVSTDEVYGSSADGQKFTEGTVLAPSSPYAATKASADLIARAYFHTYKFPAIITRCSNNYGPYQYPEKFIPLLISCALGEQSLPIYGDGMQIRDWIHVSDHCVALDMVLRHGREGEVYNIGGGSERTNLEVARLILRLLGKSESLLTFVKDRPGHDRHYAVDSRKIHTELGWAPQIPFDKGIAETVEWYTSHRDWERKVRDAQYCYYYERQYSRRDSTLGRVLRPAVGKKCAS